MKLRVLQPATQKFYSIYNCKRYIFATLNFREVPEWLKGLAWKAGIRETVSRVRIPSSLQQIPNRLTM